MLMNFLLYTTYKFVSSKPELMLIFDYRKSSFSIIDDNEEYFKLVDE